MSRYIYVHLLKTANWFPLKLYMLTYSSVSAKLDMSPYFPDKFYVHFWLRPKHFEISQYFKRKLLKKRKHFT